MIITNTYRDLIQIPPTHLLSHNMIRRFDEQLRNLINQPLGREPSATERICHRINAFRFNHAFVPRANDFADRHNIARHQTYWGRFVTLIHRIIRFVSCTFFNPQTYIAHIAPINHGPVRGLSILQEIEKILEEDLENTPIEAYNIDLRRAIVEAILCLQN